jgi:hypothetical protein
MSSLLLDPSRPHIIDVAALTEFLAGLDDDRLRDVEEEFRLAAYGRPIRLRDDDPAVQFKGTSVVIPWEIGSVIRSYRVNGTPLLSNLETLAARVGEALTESDIAEMEAQWKL